MESNSILSNSWYYKIEIEKGIFTKGIEHQNLGLTRKLLRNIDIHNKTCIDLGTQEAVIPILLKRAGANLVVGYDRFDLSEKINIISTAYQVEFDYIRGIQLQDLPETLDETKLGRSFDLVVFSGILYHMINPFGLMALVRGLCKTGGLFLIETAAIQHPKEMLIFNARGRIYGSSSNYFIPTTSWLDYALRMVGLMPLQAVYLGKINSESPIRLAILCRGQDSPCPLDKNDKWMLENFHSYIFTAEAQFDWKRLGQTQGEIAYHPYDKSVLPLNNKSLYDGLVRHPPYKPLTSETILTLDSKI
jgi:hypothetical protein